MAPLPHTHTNTNDLES